MSYLRNINPFNTNLVDPRINALCSKGYTSSFRTRLMKVYNIVLFLYSVAICIVMLVELGEKHINDPTDSFKTLWGAVFFIFAILSSLLLPFLANLGKYGTQTRANKLRYPVANFLGYKCSGNPVTENCGVSWGNQIYGLFFIGFGICLIIFGVDYSKKITNEEYKEWKQFGQVGISLGAMYILLGLGLVVFGFFCPYGTEGGVYPMIVSFIIILGILAFFILVPISAFTGDSTLKAIVGGTSGVIGAILLGTIIYSLVKLK